MQTAYHFLFGSFYWQWFLLLPLVLLAKRFQAARRGTRRRRTTRSEDFHQLPNPHHAENFLPPASTKNAAVLPLTMRDIDTMSGRTFEQILQTLFEKQGFAVTLTPLFGDWGADLVLEKDGVRTLVQAKRWNRKVGLKAVQEVVAAKAKYQAQNAMVVTNSYFYWQAEELARVNHVVLWNRRTLSDQLSRFPMTLPPRVENTLPHHSPPKTEWAALPCAAHCATCGKPVTQTVLAYCHANQSRFNGQVLCFNHQKQTRFRKARV